MTAAPAGSHDGVLLTGQRVALAAMRHRRQAGQVRTRDAENAIYDGLRALEWYRYLAAMWIICGELRDLYADRLTESERSLLADSLAAVRIAVLDHQVSDSAASDATALNVAWEQLIPDQTVPPDQLGALRPGHWNMRVVLADLVGEIAGTCRRYQATERIHHAAGMRFEEKPRPGGRPIRRRPDEQIDDASPRARMLSRIQAIVTGAAQLPGDDERDPARLRARLLTL